LFAILFATALLLPQSPSQTAPHNARTDEKDNGLTGEFALEKGPRFSLLHRQQVLVDQAIEEIKQGYGGSLATVKGPDSTLDSSFFLSRYLREFSTPQNKNSLKDYDYRFKRILARASNYPTMLDDPRLDWDVYRALLAYEKFSDGTDQYKTGTGTDSVINELDSAKDLAWMYIEHQSDRLVKDKARQRWWVDHLVQGFNSSSGSRVSRWFLLQLCLLADPSRKQISVPSPDDYPKTPIRTPSTDDPFLMVRAGMKPPAFKDALQMIVGPLGLSFEVWGIDPGKMPPARVLAVSLEMTKWPTDRSTIIGQESWSRPEAGTLEYGVRFFHTFGQRAAYSHVSFPSDRRDGVFFFCFNKHLYVWPKEEMDGGTLQIARIAGLIDDAMWARLVSTRGVNPLKTTLTGY